MKKLTVPLLAVLGFATFVAVTSVYTVNERQQALLFQFGEIKAVHDEAGLYFKRSILQDVVYREKRLLRYDLPERQVILGDTNRLIVDAIVRYKIIDGLKFYQRVSDERGLQRLLDPILEANLRGQLGEISVKEVLSGERAVIMQRIAADSSKSTADLGIEVVDVRIVRVDLPRQNTEGVVQQMIAERQREAAEQRAQGQKTSQEIRSKADRDSTIIIAEAQKTADIMRGEGEAQRNKVFAAAFSKDPEFFEFYRSMQAYRTALNNDDTTMVLSPDGDFFKYFGSDKGRK